jgi:hypothetical protein
MSSKKFKTETVQDATVEDMKEAPAQFAAASVDRMEAAFDAAAGAAHGQAQSYDASTAAFKARSTDLQMKLMEFAQANVGAAFAFTRALLGAKEPQTYVKLNQDFTKDRFEVFANQSRELQQLTLALVSETAKPMQEGFSKSVAAFSKAA